MHGSTRPLPQQHWALPNGLIELRTLKDPARGVQSAPLQRVGGRQHRSPATSRPAAAAAFGEAPSAAPEPDVAAPSSGLMEYFVTCHPGLEHVVARELQSDLIGARDVAIGKAGVSCRGDSAVGYRANLWLRSAIRVLALLAELPLDAQLPGGDAVYEATREAADWPALLPPGQTFSVDGRCWSCSQLSNSKLMAVRCKDAVCDAIRDRRGLKPDPPEPGRVADLPLFLSAYQDRLTIYRDMSGASLHRRGWRQAMHKASLNESAAAGLLLLAGWDEICRQGGATLADPMVGSGTFAIEAAHIATQTAPGSFRGFWPFTRWDDFDRPAWAEAQQQAAELQTRSPGSVTVWGNDIHPGALSLAVRDATQAGVRPLIRLHHGDARSWKLPHAPNLVITNPPWGGRLLGAEEDADFPPSEAADRAPQRGLGRPRLDRREAEQLEETWFGLSVFLKEQCGKAQASILCGNPEASKALRLKAARRDPVTIGGIDCRLLTYYIRGRKEGGTPPVLAAEQAVDGS